MITMSQAVTMLEMQFAMNARVNPAWLSAGYPYLRAIVVEGAEGMEHHGWKWWKAQAKDLPQLQMELVDIWHFALSAMGVSAQGSAVDAAHHLLVELSGPKEVVFDGKIYAVDSLDIVAKLELMVGLAVARRFSVPLFAAAMVDCEMSWDELYRQYVSKNVLNFFRQDNGYKEGSYRKVWQGREDNEHLVEILVELDAAARDFRDQIYAGLERRYQEALQG